MVLKTNKGQWYRLVARLRFRAGSTSPNGGGPSAEVVNERVGIPAGGPSSIEAIEDKELTMARTGTERQNSPTSARQVQHGRNTADPLAVDDAIPVTAGRRLLIRLSD